MVRRVWHGAERHAQRVLVPARVHLPRHHHPAASRSYSSRSRVRSAAHAASSTTDTVQLRLRSRDVGSPRRPLAERATLELRWCTWPAMVVPAGPPGRDAAAALTPPMVANTPVPRDVSMK